MDPITIATVIAVKILTGYWPKNSEEDSELKEITPQKEYKVDFRKTTQSEEPIGTETRKIDSRNSKVKIERNLKVSKEWSRTIQITLEQSSTQSMEKKIGGSLGISKSCTLDGAISNILEEKISEQFQITQQEKRTYEESIRIEVPPNEYVEIHLNWKQIWQHGEVVLIDAESGKDEQKIPFRFIDHITFDMS